MSRAGGIPVVHSGEDVKLVFMYTETPSLAYR